MPEWKVSVNAIDAKPAILPIWALGHPVHMDKEWLRNELRKRGRGAQVQLAAVLGIHATVMNKMINGPRKISSDEADKIRAWLKGALPEPQQGSFLAPTRVRQPSTPAPILNTADIPVWASVAAGNGEGEMILTDTPIDFIRRSDHIAHAVDPFAFYIVGDSMEERFYQGDQVVVNRSLPLRPGDDCVFISQGLDGQLRGLVKRLMRSTADSWKVRQLNPRRDFDLPKRAWSKAYRIVEIRPRS